MPRRLESLTIFDLIPFMDDGWLVYQPEHDFDGYTLGGHWELCDPDFEPEICGCFWDFNGWSSQLSALNIAAPADWRTAKYKIEKGSIIKGK